MLNYVTAVNIGTITLFHRGVFYSISIFAFFFSVDFAVAQCQFSTMANQGQICCSGARTFVQDTIYDEFVKKSIEAANKRTVGDPTDPSNENGAQVKPFDRAQRIIISRYPDRHN